MNVLTIDVGGSFIKYANMDENRNITNKGQIKTPVTGLEDYLAALDFVVQSQKEPFEGIAISAPGIINPETGYFFTGGFLDDFIHEIDLKGILEKRYGCFVSCANDAKCAAMAELAYGALQNVDEAMVFILGTAVGGAFIHEGKVLNGKHFTAGEVSFLLLEKNPVDIESSLYGELGNHCLLQIASEKMGGKPEDYDGKKIFEKVNANDPEALKVLEEFAKRVAYFIYNMQVIYDADKIAIGGGISAQPRLIEEINRQVEKIYRVLFRPLREESWPKIVACQYKNDANLIGAFAHYQNMKRGIYGRK